MKSTIGLAAAAFLIFSAAGAAAKDVPYPADAEASTSPPPLDTYADRHARNANGGGSEQWGVGKRQAPTPHDPFPFGGGYHDD